MNVTEARRVYIAGPMRGRAHWNFPAFDASRDLFRALGWVVVSPADLDRVYEGWDLRPPPHLMVDHGLRVRCIARDLQALLTFQPGKDAIYMLTGWEKSAGARAEKALAEFLGLLVLYEVNA